MWRKVWSTGQKDSKTTQLIHGQKPTRLRVTYDVSRQHNILTRIHYTDFKCTKVKSFSFSFEQHCHKQ